MWGHHHYIWNYSLATFEHSLIFNANSFSHFLSDAIWSDFRFFRFYFDRSKRFASLLSFSGNSHRNRNKYRTTATTTTTTRYLSYRKWVFWDLRLLHAEVRSSSRARWVSSIFEWILSAVSRISQSLSSCSFQSSWSFKRVSHYSSDRKLSVSVSISFRNFGLGQSLKLTFIKIILLLMMLVKSQKNWNHLNSLNRTPISACEFWNVEQTFVSS
jgi:hypothetical protein